jgi:16S rRNA G966 N2-methylase RsmD
MKNFIFLYLFVLLGLISCERQTAQQLKKEQPSLLSKDKKIFLDSININITTHEFRYQLDSAAISLKDLVYYCQQSKNIAHTIGLVQLVCAGMENNLEEQNHEYWAGILYDLRRFYENIAILKSEKQKIFMDIGSGNGEKLFTALCLGFERAIGIEYSDSLVNIANRNLHLFTLENKIQNIHADAFQVAPQLYQQADFIYLYSPIKDNMQMAKLAQKILQEMKNGALLMEVRFVYGEELEKLTQWQFPPFGGTLVIKKQDDEFYFAEFDHHQTTWREVVKKTL